MAAVVENRPSEGSEKLNEYCDKSLVSRALPDQSKGNAPIALRLLRKTDESVQIARCFAHEIGSPVQHASVDEPRQRVKRTAPPIGGHGRCEELVDRLLKTI